MKRLMPKVATILAIILLAHICANSTNIALIAMYCMIVVLGIYVLILELKLRRDIKARRLTKKQ